MEAQLKRYRSLKAFAGYGVWRGLPIFACDQTTDLDDWMANERINHKAREFGDYIVLPLHLWKFLLIVEFLHFFKQITTKH